MLVAVALHVRDAKQMEQRHKTPVPLVAVPIEPSLISTRIRDVGIEVVQEFEQWSQQDGSIELTVVVILSGAFMFAADLIRAFRNRKNEPHPNLACRICFVRAASRPNPDQTHPMKIDILGLDPKLIAGCNVLIVDDILDSGHTLRAIRQIINDLKPRHVSAAILLDKESAHGADVKAEHRAFRVENLWVVGYGMDQNGLYRNLPMVDALDRATNRPASWAPTR